jgi:hypothetical protein
MVDEKWYKNDQNFIYKIQLNEMTKIQDISYMSTTIICGES